MVMMPLLTWTRWPAWGGAARRPASRGATAACCLVLAVVFSSRAGLALLVPDAFAAADPACESELESPLEELGPEQIDEWICTRPGEGPLLTTDRRAPWPIANARRLRPPQSAPPPLLRGPPA